MAKPQAARVIYWHRTDLRLHDSPALQAALDLEPECLWHIFTWDSHYVHGARISPNRWSFLLASLRTLSARITALNPDSKLYVLREPPQTLIPKLFAAQPPRQRSPDDGTKDGNGHGGDDGLARWRPTHLVFERDTDAYARLDRDARVIEALRPRAAEVVVLTRDGRTLFDPDELVRRNGGRPTMSMAELRRAVAGGGGEAELAVPRPVPVPARCALPGPGGMVEALVGARVRAEREGEAGRGADEGEEKTYAFGLAGPKGDFGVPEMGELGLGPAEVEAGPTAVEGGETSALEALRRVLDDARYVATFEKPAKAPTEWDPPATTVLSPHLHFGTLGVRQFWWGVRDAVARYERENKGRKASGIPVNLEGQLLFREMYFAAQAALGHRFAQAHNNPQCRHIPWHLPSRIDPATGLALYPAADSYVVDDAGADRWFRRWRAAATGFPWIDALMRQLRRTGFVEHLGRHALACFLTRGGCYVHWERGAAVFAELLVDHEPAANAGNWMWLACAAFFAHFHRVYSPTAFPRRWDPDGAFVRHWVPELAAFDKKFIYEPWKAPVADQKKWRCRVLDYDDAVHGGDGARHPPAPSYPKPMFDFDERRRVCIAAMKKAYDVGLYGDDKRVLDGSWKELFDDHGPEGAAGGAQKQESVSDDGNDGVAGVHGAGGEAEKGKGRMAAGGAATASQKRARPRQGTLDGIVKRSRKT